MKNKFIKSSLDYEEMHKNGDKSALDAAVLETLRSLENREELKIEWLIEALLERYCASIEKPHRQFRIGALITSLEYRGCSQNICFKALGKMLGFTERHVANCFYNYRRKFSKDTELEGLDEIIVQTYLKAMADMFAYSFLIMDEVSFEDISDDYPTVRREIKKLAREGKDGSIYKSVERAAGNLKLPTKLKAS